MLASYEAESYLVTKLLENEELNEQTLISAQLESEFSGLPLAEVFVARDLVSQEALAQAFAQTTDTKYLDLARRNIPEAWVRSLPENVARRKYCLPLGELKGQLIVAVADPADRTVINMLGSRFDKDIQLVVSPRYQIVEAQDRVYGQARARGAREADATPTAPSTAVTNITGMNMVEILDSVIDEAVDRRASDIHIEPEDDRLRVRMRIDGRMIESRAYPMDALSALVSRVKVLATLDITERRAPQDGRFEHTSFNQKIDIRVATIPTVTGERVTLRLLGVDSRVTEDFQSLGMDPDTERSFRKLIRRPHGIILMTGPTGSGKTTTLYTGLQEINTVDRNIVTIENPVEYHIKGINQIQVDPENGVTFAGALRSIVRHDPDVIMVGEIRDTETAHLAIEASLTGHLVFATLHTNSAVGAITRLVDMGCEPYLVASSLIGIMAQRLVRRICDNCKVASRPTPAEMELLGLSGQAAHDAQIYRGRGCARCMRTGYYERIGIYEHVPFNRGLAERITQKTTMDELHQYAIEHGARTLRMDAIDKVLQGLTTMEEALRITAADTLD